MGRWPLLFFSLDFVIAQAGQVGSYTLACSSASPLPLQ